jgi:leucyl-tRNA---protein transferase
MQPRLADHIFMYRLSAQRLDKLLESGYFRNANIMFQSQVLCLDGQLCDVVNIRLPLQDYQAPKRIARIASKVESRFSITTGKAVITPEKEVLYEQHRKRFKGFQYRNLHQMLYGDSPIRIFNTQEICIYDGNKLIAYSFFDAGHKSIASILGVFDNEYSKYSLGLYTMFAEIKWALQRQISFFYPGYILKGTHQFDYKLLLGNFEFYDWDDATWRSHPAIQSHKSAGDVLKAAMMELSAVMDKYEIEYSLRMYPFFSLGYLSLSNFQFYVRSPMHLFVRDYSTEGAYIIAEYDPDERMFVCSTVRENDSYQELMKGHEHMRPARSAHEWDCVLEYQTVVRYISAESLVRDLLNNEGFQ